IEVVFPHGTYISLYYTNIRYMRGYVDQYVKQSALMNSHVNIIYQDPYNETHIYKRLVNEFPEEPKYAKPHPSSINIGEFQDMIRTSSYNTVKQFLVNSFVRLSDKVANRIITNTENDLEDRLKLLRISDTDFITLAEKDNEYVYLSREEKRVYGRSTKKRKIQIIYMLNIGRENAVNKYQEICGKYKGTLDNINKIMSKIKKLVKKQDSSSTKKEKSEIGKKIRALEKEKAQEEKNKKALKKDFLKFVNNNIDAFEEISDEKVFEVIKDKIKLILVSKASLKELQELQVNTLFKYFTREKYLSPPTDTAIPVGADVLENVLIQEFNLKISKFDEYFTDDGNPQKIEHDPEYYLEFRKELQDRLEEENEGESESKISQLLKLDESEFLHTMATLPLKNFLKLTGRVKNGLVSQLVNVDAKSYQHHELFNEEIIEEDLDFVGAVTRSPTSGKGLAFVVEVAIAYGKNIRVPTKASDIVYRFVNRTPKLRDNSDCAIWKTVCSVNWKNYNLDTFDNGIPKGPIRLFINVSGPFVHLMFKSQSKQALADDENLTKEIKLALEQVGRRLRIYLSKKQKHADSKKRASRFIKFAPIVAKSIYNILARNPEMEKKIQKPEVLEERLIEGIKSSVPLPPTPINFFDDKITVAETVIEPSKTQGPEKAKERTEEAPKGPALEKKKDDAKIETGRSKKTGPEVKKIEVEAEKTKAAVEKESKSKDLAKKAGKSTKKPKATGRKEAGRQVKKSKREPAQKSLQFIPVTDDNILKMLPKDEWVKISYLIKKFMIKELADARYLKIKLKTLEKKGLVAKQTTKDGRDVYKRV
ncbi:MAG: hypothetical protein ACTSRA_15315, partial [Promethearchaeota archaeon]